MKLPNLSLLLILFIFSGCLQKTNTKDHNLPEANENTLEIQSNEISKKSDSWLNAVKEENLHELKDNYAEKAIKIISADSIISGASNIADYYINQSIKITESESLFLTEANKNEGIDYELVSYKTKDIKEYIQVVIWKSIDGRKLREFEYAVKRDVSNPKVYEDQISKRRDQWMQLCNEHNAENLVKRLYAPNAIYFNHKPLVIGTEAISKEYQYMNNDTYNLTLEPLIVEMITENIAFEIGQCKGSYGGKYVIVWKKETEGNWKVFIDSNF